MRLSTVLPAVVCFAAGVVAGVAFALRRRLPNHADGAEGDGTLKKRPREPLEEVVASPAKRRAVSAQSTQAPSPLTVHEKGGGEVGPALLSPGLSVDVLLPRFIDPYRWQCACRPQYKYSCGISSLVAIWNYLYSTLGPPPSRGGRGAAPRLPPITQEAALKVLGFQEPFSDIRFGPFTGNATIARWFTQLNRHFGAPRGKAGMLYKAHGRGKTPGMTPALAAHRLVQQLRDPAVAFIYHCKNHYMICVGYCCLAESPEHAYAADPGAASPEHTLWLIFADSSRKQSPLHCIRYSDVIMDLQLQNPEFLDVRKLDLGIQRRTNVPRRTVGRNLHCLMVFRSDVDADFGVTIVGGDTPAPTSGLPEGSRSRADTDVSAMTIESDDDDDDDDDDGGRGDGGRGGSNNDAAGVDPPQKRVSF